ncbi:ferritin-like domain-containing protein [Ramlibacter sp. XY19]|uniref:ferritin-like domain-containing protein n=1 Tax=Ramlibacter paludis TaxID=2908000 RepID=UPI0023DC20CA|nr:ferritin-like domain-containing protein [Ramlibacter paludis]MCG2593899.1 ferritin-like domain-containing protein [Ramlibacter paludis]
MELRQRALDALCCADPDEKVALATALGTSAARSTLSPHAPQPSQPVPGRPQRPELIHPARVPRRSPAKPEGLAALLHAIAHIEFNAINLALDAAWRFEGMPREFHDDWIRVAAEEAYHFTLLRDHLASLGHAYGDFPAHDGLWMMCEKTAGDVVARMALVPRTLEARGLDATPQIQAKLRQVKTPAALRAVEILDIILRDEVGHVAVGNHWYRWLCEREALDPVAHYGVLVDRYAAPRLYPPFNEEARLRAGFSEEELAWLTAPRP